MGPPTVRSGPIPSPGEGPKRQKIPAWLGLTVICLRLDGDEWGQALWHLIKLYYGANEIDYEPGDPIQERFDPADLRSL